MATQVNFGSFNLNAQASGYYVTEVPYSITPVVETFYKIARFEGQKRTSLVTNERQIQLKMMVISTAMPPTRADLEQRLSTMYSYLIVPQQPLTMFALDSRYVICDCTGADATLASGQPIAAQVTLTFVAQQPYFMATTQSTFDTGIVTLTSAGSNNYTFATQTILGGGTIFSRPVIQIFKESATPTWNSVTLVQDTDEVAIAVSAGLPSASGDYLQFICDPSLPNGYSVLKNGTGNPLAFSGTFPQLESGTTTWSITVNASAQPLARALWTWTPRWV